MALFGQKKERQPKKYYLWIFLGVVVIGLVLYLYQSLQPSLAEDPNKALDQVITAMSHSENAIVEFEHRLGEDLENPALLISGEAEAFFPSEYIGHIEISGADPVLEQSPVPTSFDFAYIDEVYYQKEGEEEAWRDFSAIEDYTPFLRLEPYTWLTYCQENAAVVREKDSEIDGQNYHVLAFSFPEEKTPEVIKPLSLMVSDIPAEATVSLRVWVNPETRKVFQTETEVALPEVGGERRLVRYIDYDSLSLLALEGDVVKEEPLTAEEEKVEQAEDERQERNEKRQIDLLAIRTALEKAYEDNNVYPESPEVVNLSDTDTEVYEVLLNYLKEMPADPLAPEYYYGYYCAGGEQYELTAIQETDKEFKVVSLTQSSLEFEEKN